MWAARPHLGSIFEKLLYRKTFCSPAAFSLQSRLFYFDALFHVKRSEIAPRQNGLSCPAKGGSTPAFACQRAAIAPLPCPNLQLVSQRQFNCELVSFKKCNCSRKTNCKIEFAPQMWAARPHLGSIFEKLLHRKTFHCLRLVVCSQDYFILMLCFT